MCAFIKLHLSSGSVRARARTKRARTRPNIAVRAAAILFVTFKMPKCYFKSLISIKM